MISEKEKIRGERIRASLRQYFLSEQGNIHKEKLKALQSKRMAKYNDFIKRYNNEEI